MNKKLLASALTLSLVAGGMTVATPTFASTFSDRLAQWGLDVDLKLFSQKFLKNSKIKGGYNYEVQPSYNEGLYTRFDRYYFNTELGNKGVSSIKDVTGSEFKVGLTTKHALEIEFARQYPDSEMAMKAMPYAFKNIPTNTEKAINGLKVGDFVSIKSHLAAIVGLDFVKSLNVNLGLTASANYLMTGEFQIHILKLPENKVRLKLVGLRSDGKEGTVGVGFAGVLNIFPVEVANKRITKILDLNPIEFRFNDGNANLFMVDYVLDLKDLEVARAYDEVLAQAYDLETLKIMNPMGSSEKLRSSLSLDIAAIDSLFVQDRIAGKVSRVQRSFRGSADSDSVESRLRLGIKLIQYEGSKRYSENRIASVTDDDVRENYVLNSFKSVSEGSLLFSFLEVRRESQMNAVFSADSNYENLLPENIVLSVERRDKRFRDIEFKKVQEQLKRTVPPSVYQNINFAKWNERVADIKNNVAVRYQVVLNPEAIAAAPQINKKEIAKRYKQYLTTVPMKSVIVRGRSPYESQTYLDSRINAIAGKLEKVFNPALSDLERVNVLMSLRSSSLFKSTGTGFLLSLLPQHKLADLVHFDLAMESSDGDRLDYSFGSREVSPIYKKLLYIQSIMDNDGLDIRLQSEMIGLSVREGTVTP